MDRLRFSRQEEKVLLLSMEGKTDQQVAEELGVGLGTVRTFWKRIRAKSGGSSRAEVMAALKRLGIDDASETGNGHFSLSEVARRKAAEERADQHERALLRLIRALPDASLTPPALAPDDAIRAQTEDAPFTTAMVGGGEVRVVPLGDGRAVYMKMREASDHQGTDTFRMARVGLAAVSSTGRIVVANPRFVQLIGSFGREVVGGLLSELITYSDRPRLTQTMKRAEANGEAQCSVNALHRSGGFVGLLIDLSYADGTFHLTVRKLVDSARLIPGR